MRFTEEIEADEDGLAAGVLIGNAFTDVPDLMSNILVCRNAGSDSGTRATQAIRSRPLRD